MYRMVTIVINTVLCTGNLLRDLKFQHTHTNGEYIEVVDMLIILIVTLIHYVYENIKLDILNIYKYFMISQ